MKDGEWRVRYRNIWHPSRESDTRREFAGVQKATDESLYKQLIKAFAQVGTISLQTILCCSVSQPGVAAQGKLVCGFSAINSKIQILHGWGHAL